MPHLIFSVNMNSADLQLVTQSSTGKTLKGYQKSYNFGQWPYITKYYHVNAIWLFKIEQMQDKKQCYHRINDLYIFPLIFTWDNIYYQATSVILTEYHSFLIWPHFTKSLINILSLICFSWNWLFISSYISCFNFDIVLRNPFSQSKSTISNKKNAMI